MVKISKQKRQAKFTTILKHVWEAVRRNSLYEDDYRKFKKQIEEDPKVALEKFRKKWNISPLDPSFSFDEILERWEKGRELGYKPKPFPVEILYRKGESKFPVSISSPSLVSKEINLTINLRAPKSEVISAVEGILEYTTRFHKIIEKSEKEKKERKREMSVDIWKVYDMHKKEGMSFLEITRLVFNVTGHPAYDPRVDSLYKQVKRAYHKAHRMIESVVQK
jgi:hypothetical protein